MAIAFGALTSIACVLLFALVTWALQLSVELSGKFGLFALGCGCLICGIIGGRYKRHAGLLTGLSAALLLFLPVVLVSLITGGFSGELFLSRLVTTIICGAVGGVIGVNHKQF